MLARLTRDLTAEARAGRLAPVRCRDAEIARVTDVLLRQGKCNPALVGPAGVGKTAIAEGLAQRIAAGDVPLSLRGVRLLALDHVSLLAGTTYRGQYEERLRVLIEETSKAGDVVLFVDELHNLIGQGTAMGVAMDAANMLKPALVRGDFRVIGATTEDEYDRWVRGDPALERRFQRVEVKELGAADTVEILRARKETLERHHHVVITDEAIDASVILSDRYVHDRVRPDRAIDALDEACAHTHARARYSPETEALINEVTRTRRERAAVDERSGATTETGAPQRTADEDGTSLEALARQGFAAIERFGAELEAALGEPMRVPARDAPAPAPATPRPTEPERTPRARPEIEIELTRRLVDEGIVVRGHDVARVIGLMSGKTIQWPE
jgi:ATP-dependent Clp protease ATP-binding subunit ClpA